MQISNIHEAKTNLSQLIQKALAGEEIIIAKAGHPLVKLMPVQQDKKPRVGGFFKGQIIFDYDADKKLDAEIADSFNNSKLFPDEV